jgi:hypothetical protein
MIGSYEVGAIFRIVNDASPTLERIASQLRGLDGLIASAKKELSSLGASFGGGLAGRIENADKALKGLDGAAAGAKGAIGSLADAMVSIGTAADRSVLVAAGLVSRSSASLLSGAKLGAVYGKASELGHDLPADVDPALRNVSSLLKSSVDIRFGFSAVKGDGSQLADFDPADIIDQIKAKGYATRAAVPTDTMIPPEW